MESRFTLVFDQFLAHIGIERGLASSTVDAYASDLRRYVEWLENRGVRTPEDIARRDVEEYVAALDAAGESARSKARRLASIHAFHRFALAQHAVDQRVGQRGQTVPAVGHVLGVRQSIWFLAGQ